MRKKVLILITKGNFGGAQRYVYDIATSLPKTKYEAVVACGDQDGNILKNKLTEAGVRVLALEGSGREVRANGDFKVLKQILKLIKEEKPDVIHLNSSKIGFLGSVVTILLKLKKLVPFAKNPHIPHSVFTAHGWAFNERNRSLLWKFIFWGCYYITVIGCDSVTAVSGKTKRDLAFLPFIKNKIEVIHNGLDIFDLLPREEARQIINAGEKTTLLSIGELHPSKGYDVALKAIAKLPQEIKEKLSYRVIGGGEEKEKLEKLKEELGLTEIVQFLGPIDNAKKLLIGADIFLFPSRNENLPYVILEAGIVGMPIIAANVGGVSEVMTDMESGILVHKENPKEIAHAIEYILKHPDRAAQFSKKIHSQVSKHFSKTKMLRETIAVYQ